jgi:uncharacterized protein
VARPQKNRTIYNPPRMKGFKPFGIPLCKTETIKLTLEEYESIRLVDYDMLPQDKAAELMSVSRPTFTRIYNKAIKTVAKALVEGKAMEFEGGNYQFDQDWFRCKKCYKLFQGIESHIKCENCLLYNSGELVNLNQQGKNG